MDRFNKLYSPESVGISSESVGHFIDEITGCGQCLHGFMLLRGSKCFAKSYMNGFDDNKTHRMYSVSKTFVSAAIGRLITEGRLSLDSKIADYFTDKTPADLHPYIAMATVRDLLRMATPFNGTTYSPADKDWASTFFTTKPNHLPGTIFNYDTSGTYILDVIVERITGMPFMDYLYETVLKYIGWTQPRLCVKAPEGYSWGGSGVLCTLPELAAFARLFMDGGKAPDGTQLIDEGYIKAACSKQISNETDNNYSQYYNCGYGYQVWIIKGGFAFLGMGNQLAVCIPEKDILLVTISDDQGNSAARETIFRSLRNFITSSADESILPENPKALECLRNRKLPGFPVPNGAAHSALEEHLSGRKFLMEDSETGIKTFKFEFNNNGGAIIYDTDRGLKRLTFGAGCFDDSEFPETHYSGMTISTPLGKGYECHTCAVWDSENVLIIRSYLTDDYFGNFTATFSFRDDTVNILMNKTAEWFLNEYRGFACGKVAEE